MTTPRMFTIVLMAGTYVISLSTSASALNQPTHKIINEEAAEQSSIDATLRSQFGISGGLAEKFQDRSALAWIGEGGIREDDGIRFFRHFHDPLKPWSLAGLGFLGKWPSSALWMQRATQCDETRWDLDWTWSSARCYFHRALTGSGSTGDKAWAYTLRALGQMMHLVVDASVPEHTRDDEHPLGIVYGNYEYSVQKLHGRPGSTEETQFVDQYLANPEWPDTSLFAQPTNDPAAPVPVARLIDSDIYEGVDPNVTVSPLIGIAEFANANFFSEDTGYRRFLSPNYPYPRVETLLPSTHPIGNGQKVRAYYRKGPGEGVPIDPVLAECALDAAARADGIPAPQMKCTDGKVWEQTARHMLPRAVGYAAALLDYFFRGAPSVSYIPGDQVVILGSGESMTGEFDLRYELTDGTRVTLAKWTGVQVPAGGASARLSVPQLPNAAAPGAPCWLIFRGQLGLESGAVAGSIVGCPPLPAPPTSGSWFVYVCHFGVYGNPQDVVYKFATENPPLWDDGLPALRFYVRASNGEGTCSLGAQGLASQPLDTVLEHPM